MSRRQIGSRQTAENDAGGQDRHSVEVDVIMDQDDADVISVSSDTSDDQDDDQDVVGGTDGMQRCWVQFVNNVCALEDDDHVPDFLFVNRDCCIYIYIYIYTYMI